MAQTDALLAWLACGWPAPPDGLLEHVERARLFGAAYGGSGEPDPLICAWEEHWNALEEVPDVALLLHASGLVHARIARVKVDRFEYETVGRMLHVVLGRLLLPVAMHAHFAAQGVLDERAVDRAARRTQKALAQGTGVSLITSCRRHRT